MVTTWLTVTLALLSGIIWGYTSFHMRNFAYGGAAGILSYCAFGPVADPMQSAQHFAVVHVSIFVIALLCTVLLRRLVRLLTLEE